MGDDGRRQPRDPIDAVDRARAERPSECSGLIEKPASLLVERAKRRDEAALVAFFGRYERGLFGYFSGPMHWHWSFVPDLVQETITRAIQGFPRFRGQSDARAERWLFGIARNVHLQEVTRQVGIRLRKDVASEIAKQFPPDLRLIGVTALRAHRTASPE